MLNVTLAIFALIVSCVIVWFAVRRSKAVQHVSNRLSGPVEQMQEQILLTADTAVDRLDGKIAQMEILLEEIDRRSAIMAQQSRQHQMQQLQIEQQQQQLLAWFQAQRQQLEKYYEVRHHDLVKLHAQFVSQIPSIPATSQDQMQTPPVPKVEAPVVEPVVEPVEIRQEREILPEPPRVKTPKVPVKAASVAKEPKEPKASKDSPTQDKRTTILDMAEQGHSVTDIAKMMGVGKGEVMLLLKLRKKAAP